MIKGESVILIEKVQVDKDAFNKPVYEENEVVVDNVIIGSPSFDASISEYNITGKRLAYILGIPKGDTHNWQDAKVFIRGEEYRTYGYPLTQTEANVPGRWNTQVKVEKYG